MNSQWCAAKHSPREGDPGGRGGIELPSSWSKETSQGQALQTAEWQSGQGTWELQDRFDSDRET